MRTVSTMLALTLTCLSSTHATTLTVWTHYRGSTQDLAWVKKAALTFGRNNAVKVDVVQIPFGSLIDLLGQRDWKAPEQAPDVVIGFPSDWLEQVVSTGIFEPLNGYRPTTSTEDPRFLEALSINNKLFALPLTAETLALVYNKALVPKPPATWNEFLKVAQANTTSARSGFLYDINNPYYNYGFIQAYGGYIFKKKGNGFDVNDIGLATPGALKATEFISDFQKRHRLIPAGITDASAKTAFLEGRLAFWLAGPWEIGDILTAGIDVGVTTFPTPPKAIQSWAPIITVSGVAVTSISSQKALAVKFAHQLSAQASQINLYQVSGRIPASPSARQALKNDPVVAGFSAALRAGNALPNIPEIDQVWEPWATASSQLLSQPPEQARQILNDLVKRITTRIQGLGQGK